MSYTYFERSTERPGHGPISLPLRFYPRSGIYKASNVIFNPETLEARSYDWWLFVRKIGQLTVFNEYPYSNTTRRHQLKVRRLLDSLGVQIHATIHAPRGLQNIQSAYDFYGNKIKKLNDEISKPRSHERKNLERWEQIRECEQKRRQVEQLIRMEARQAARANRNA